MSVFCTTTYAYFSLPYDIKIKQHRLLYRVEQVAPRDIRARKLYLRQYNEIDDAITPSHLNLNIDRFKKRANMTPFLSPPGWALSLIASLTVVMIGPSTYDPGSFMKECQIPSSGAARMIGENIAVHPLPPV